MAALVQRGERDLQSRIAEALGLWGTRFSVLEPLVTAPTNTAPQRAARLTDSKFRRPHKATPKRPLVPRIPTRGTPVGLPSKGLMQRPKLDTLTVN
jgi:hypothetical protein